MDQATASRIRSLIGTIGTEFRDIEASLDPDGKLPWLFECRKLIARAGNVAVRLTPGTDTPYANLQTLATLARGLGEYGLPVRAGSPLDHALADLQHLATTLLLRP